ncbi:hypothetical protein ACJX0J_006858 [Zea mays]
MRQACVVRSRFCVLFHMFILILGLQILKSIIHTLSQLKYQNVGWHEPFHVEFSGIDFIKKGFLVFGFKDNNMYFQDFSEAYFHLYDFLYKMHFVEILQTKRVVLSQTNLLKYSIIISIYTCSENSGCSKVLK